MGYIKKAVCNSCGVSKSEGNKWLGGTLRLTPGGARPAQFEALVMKEEDVARWSEDAKQEARLWCGVPCMLRDGQAVLELLAGHEGPSLRRIMTGDGSDSSLARPRGLQ